MITNEEINRYESLRQRVIDRDILTVTELQELDTLDRKALSEAESSCNTDIESGEGC